MTARRLPVKQLFILSLCRFAEPIALTSVFPYLPEMIESFGVAKNDIARWAGITSAVFSICQGLTGIPWGAASDRFGRKPIILIGYINTMVTMLIFGFSTSLPMAIAARALQGLGNGNVGILRTTVAELCPWRELQPRAFSVMPLVYTVGAVIGPTLGGSLSNPLHTDPSKPRGDRFLERYPYCLPNLVAGCLFCIGITSGWLFLKESNVATKHKRDLGRVVGAKLTSSVRRLFNVEDKEKKYGQSERDPLLGPKKPSDEESTLVDSATGAQIEPAPRVRDVLSYQTCLNLVVYTLLALYTLAYDQILPVFMHHPPQDIDDPNVSLPFKFAGGFGIGSQRIGLIFTTFSLSTVFVQFIIFPPIARKLGVLRCLRISFHIFPVIFFITPFVSLLPTPASKETAIIILLVIRGIAGTFSFPTSTIMLTNSASSLRLLGTLNGLATSVSAIGRASGPAGAGGLFSLGVKKGYVILPFWALALISFIATIPTWFLVEGKGFGDDPDSEDESAASASAASSINSQEDVPDGDDETDAAVSESGFGEPTNLLSYTSTRSSIAMMSDDEGDEHEEEGERRHHRNGEASGSLGRIRSRSRSRRPLHRRSSIPVGMDLGLRRLSSNLGTTGIGAGGSSWGGT